MHFQPTHDHQPRLPKTTIFAIIALCCCCWLLSAPHANPKQTSFGIKDEDKYEIQLLQNAPSVYVINIKSCTGIIHHHAYFHRNKVKMPNFTVSLNPKLNSMKL